MADAPKRLGKYEILSTIGDGGMAVVYRARLQAQIDGPGLATKQVALKVIRSHLIETDHLTGSGAPDTDFSLMFVDEVRIAMAMSHRNVVQTFDAGTHDEQHFMVMEVVEGCSLRRLLAAVRARDEQLPIELALFIAIEVCGALEFAHAFRAENTDTPGVVHRDVSPSNILLSRHGEVKLADFGVAKAAGRLAVSAAPLIKGKLSYMAPEQARGEVEARSDVFALGAVLYEMCCGRPLRERADLDSVRIGTTITAPTRHRADISAGLERAMLSCLSSDASARPSAAELKRTLSDEAFALQMAFGGSRDMHATLREYIKMVGADDDGEQHDGAAGAQSKPADKDAARIARAMLEHALAVPTDHGELSSVVRATQHEADTVIDNPRLPLAEELVATTPVGADGEDDLYEDEGDTAPVSGGFDTQTSSARHAFDEAKTAIIAPAPRVERIGALDDETFDHVDAPAVTATAVAGARRRKGRWLLPAAIALLLFAGGALGVRALLLSEASDADHRGSAAGSTASVLAKATRADAAVRAPTPDAAVRAPTADVASATPAADSTLDAAGRAVDAANVRPPPSHHARRPAARKRARRRWRRRRRRVAPSKRAHGTLDVNSVPWAKVWVDGKYRGQTPVQRVVLSVGRHRVRLVNEGLSLTRTVTVRVRKNQTRRLVVRLAKP